MIDSSTKTGQVINIAYNAPMPELPEVETVRLQLLHKIVGKRIKKIEIYKTRTVAHDPTFESRLKNQTIKYIDRIGKLLIFSFDKKPDLFLLAHLKMTGQFFYIDKKGQIVGGGHSDKDSENITFPHKHSRVAFGFDGGGTLYFNDMRLFGYLKIATKQEVEVAKSRFGPEPIHPEFDTKWFTTTLLKKKTTVKAALLNQQFVAGLGNIYVDEALWRAKVLPTRICDTMTKKEAVAIATSSGDVMNESIKVGGTTFQHFIDTDGNKGNFSSFLKVFGKQGTSCPRCGHIIEKTRVAGRGTHFCPGCQK